MSLRIACTDLELALDLGASSDLSIFSFARGFYLVTTLSKSLTVLFSSWYLQNILRSEELLCINLCTWKLFINW